MDIERCVMVSEKNGVIAWDNYLTREFERICQENDVDSIEVVIESIVIDTMGKVMGHTESSSILSTGTDNHDPTTFRNLKGVIIDVLSLDGKDLSSMPYEERLMKAADWRATAFAASTLPSSRMTTNRLFVRFGVVKWKSATTRVLSFTLATNATR